MFQLQPNELIIDNFAGGGGASLGIELALGRSPDIAINHDPEAIAMHRHNHPHTRHYCESVWDVSPRKACAGRPVGLAWFSPDCKHFSKAKGGRPVDKNIRGLAWVVIRWARDVQPRIIFLENVEEFQTWGPICPDTNMPIKARKGETFRRWVNELESLGYRVEWRELKACDYGAPTTRKRLFLVARRDGLPIVWPTPTHGPGRQPYRTAAECIDWSIPCPSIFERKRPLAENTLRRTARGIFRHTINCPNPFIVRLGHTGHGDGGKSRSANEPLSTITSKNEHCLVTPTLIQSGYGERPGQAPRSLDLHKPLGTIVAGGNKFSLVAAFLAKHYTGVVGQKLDQPLGTITSVDHHSLVACHLQRDFGRSISAPLDEPVPTLMGRNKTGVVACHIRRDFGNSVGSAADEPLPTVTAGGAGKSALVTSHLVKLRGGLDTHQKTTQDLREPAPTITAGGNHLAEVRAFLVKYYGTGNDQALGEPLHTITAKARFGLVTVEGQEYQIVDIGFRMLQPRELFTAQGFPSSYWIDIQHEDEALTKEAQVRMVGNSVSPPCAKALVMANAGASEALGPDVSAWHPGIVASGEQMALFDLEAIA